MDDDGLLARWIDGYVTAWSSNEPDDIGALFTEDAEYVTEPYATPWRGRRTIVDQWIEHKDEPGDASFAWSPLVVTPDVAVVQGHTVYREPPRTYDNLWVIRLADDGRCRSFTEWWMRRPD
jgi:hypothetical protein